MSPLEAELRAIIAASGPIPISRYMALCLAHPEHGYYMNRDPLGRAGDFITAPEISQMFGELIGLWAAAVWQQMGSPRTIRLIELGPGRGTMMADALRAARALPAFQSALQVHLVETSPQLVRRQRATLGELDVPIHWHQNLAEVAEGVAIILANEFFDALPVHQAVKGVGGWHERLVGLDDGGRLAFAVAPTPSPPIAARMPRRLDAEATPGAIFEWRCADGMHALAARVANEGAALIIDYGQAESALGDTLQAVRGHRYAEVLAAPGEADLTAHVDFTALRAAAEHAGARVHGPVGQGVLLRRLGIETRAARLKAAAPTKAAAIDAALARLTAPGPTGMGTLFKALALSAPQLGPLPGFDP
jgi:NADH dehydrogenase [ubiquinone] 1 alpha subcomplex assembly factor 7